MSEVFCDIGYNNRMIKKRKNTVTVWLLVATKENELRKTKRPKKLLILRF